MNLLERLEKLEFGLDYSNTFEYGYAEGVLDCIKELKQAIKELEKVEHECTGEKTCSICRISNILGTADDRNLTTMVSPEKDKIIMQGNTAGKKPKKIVLRKQKP